MISNERLPDRHQCHLGIQQGRHAHLAVVGWIEATPERSQHLSVLTLAEIEKGIFLLDEGKRRQEIKQWFENDLPARFAGRILSVDKHAASVWEQFIAALLKQGRPLPTIDSLLAATALAHDLIFVTRNVKHFVGLRLPVFNPWDQS